MKNLTMSSKNKSDLWEQNSDGKRPLISFCGAGEALGGHAEDKLLGVAGRGSYMDHSSCG